MIEIADVYEKVGGMWGWPDGAKWLTARSRWLGDKRPCDLIETEEGREKVMNYLGAIENGVYL